MKLINDVYYRTRDGRKVGPMHNAGFGFFGGLMKTVHGKTITVLYHKDGKSMGNVPHFDLVSSWDAPAVLAQPPERGRPDPSPNITTAISKIRDQMKVNLTYFSKDDAETLALLQSHIEDQLYEIECHVYDIKKMVYDIDPSVAYK